jgi:trimeric autotransporter adhesin
VRVIDAARRRRYGRERMQIHARLSCVSALLAAVAFASVAGVAPAAAASGDIGYRDFSYAPLGGSPTGSKPESKLWFNNGWWASMFNPAASEYRIYRLNLATEAWSDTGVAIDSRDSSRADTLWVPSTGKLFVASHKYVTSGSSAPAAASARLYRYSYNTSTNSYSLDPGFPVKINSATSETLVIDRDSTGTLWATWTQDSHVYVNHTVGGNDAAWGSPYVVPGPGTSLTSDDISSLIHFGGDKIGVMWSNQTDHKFYFSDHTDGASDAAWSTNAVPTTSSSDDHINLKADSAGRVYAVVKTSAGTSSPSATPMILLLVRAADGTWSTTVVGTAGDNHTRPIVLLDEPHLLLHVFLTCPQPPKTSAQAGGDICEKTTSLSAPSFAPGIGTTVIREAGSPDMNDATSTKQNVSAATGIVVLANNATSNTYWHMYESIPGSAPPSVGPPPSARGRLNPRLRITYKRWRGLRLHVAGRLARPASGRVTVRFVEHLHGKWIRSRRTARVHRGRFSDVLRLPRRARGHRAILLAHYSGDSAYRPQTRKARLH